MQLNIIYFLIQYIILLLPALMAVAYLTLIERKILGFVQRRQGPNVTGFFGLLQPFADALKLLIKEIVQPIQANPALFLLAPVISFSLSLVGLVVMPLSPNHVPVDVNLALLYILAISSLSIYGLIIAGLASNSRYSFLGALRSSAQLIAYEISLGFILLTVVVPINSFNILDIIYFQEDILLLIPYFLSFIMFYVSMLAELNRPPFDLPEAEAELVSGYNVEYSGTGFALFFIGEYMHIIFLSAVCSMVFLGGLHIPFLQEFMTFKYRKIYYFDYLTYKTICDLVFVLKTMILTMSVFLCRAVLPRYRYDQLMLLGLKVFLPFSICLFFSIVAFYFLIGEFPDFTVQI